MFRLFWIKIDNWTLQVSDAISAIFWRENSKISNFWGDICSKLEKFGAFFDIEPNLSALCHNSQISWTDTNAKASKIFSVSEKVKLKCGLL